MNEYFEMIFRKTGNVFSIFVCYNPLVATKNGKERVRWTIG